MGPKAKVRSVLLRSGGGGNGAVHVAYMVAAPDRDQCVGERAEDGVPGLGRERSVKLEVISAGYLCLLPCMRGWGLDVLVEAAVVADIVREVYTSAFKANRDH